MHTCTSLKPQTSSYPQIHRRNNESWKGNPVNLERANSSFAGLRHNQVRLLPMTRRSWNEPSVCVYVLVFVACFLATIYFEPQRRSIFRPHCKKHTFRRGFKNLVLQPMRAVHHLLRSVFFHEESCMFSCVPRSFLRPPAPDATETAPPRVLFLALRPSSQTPCD